MNTETLEGPAGDMATRMADLLTQNCTVVEDDDPRLSPKPKSEVLDRLLKARYPTRHVQALRGDLNGPGLDKAKELWKSHIKGGDALIFLIGDRGPGKTQMATWWAGRRLQHDLSAGRYVKCADLMGEIKATWHDGNQRAGTELDVLKRYRCTKMLVIDEFHERGGSEWESRCLVNLIDHRYDDMLLTILIANLSEEEAHKEINPSILSRAQQTGGMVVCDWPSYRNITL